MNEDQRQRNFDQIKDKLKEIWVLLSDDDIASYNSNKDQFYGKLQEKYGLDKEEAELQFRNFERTQKDRDSEEPKDGGRLA